MSFLSKRTGPFKLIVLTVQSSVCAGGCFFPGRKFSDSVNGLSLAVTTVPVAFSEELLEVG